MCPAVIRLVLAGSMWYECCWWIKDPCRWNLLISLSLLQQQLEVSAGPHLPFPLGSLCLPASPVVHHLALCCLHTAIAFLFFLPTLHLLLHLIYAVYIPPCYGCSVRVKSAEFATVGLPVSHPACPGGGKWVGGALIHVPPHFRGSAGFLSLLSTTPLPAFPLKGDAEGSFVMCSWPKPSSYG